MTNFGNQLKELRLESGMTQKQLAERIGVTSSAISYYERQKCYPSSEVLIRLAYIFQTSTDYLLGLKYDNLVDVSNLSQEEIQCLYQMIKILEDADG